MFGQNKGITTNYTDDDRKQNVKADVVLYLGQDNRDQDNHKKSFEKIKAVFELQNLKYFILGNGSTDVNLDNVKQLPKANNFIVFYHGSVRGKFHVVEMMDENIYPKSLEVIQMVQAQIECKNIIACSCLIGKVIDDIKSGEIGQLQDGSFIAAFSEPDERSLHDTNAKIITAYIKIIKPKSAPSMIEFVGEMVKTFSETIVLGYQFKNEMVSKTISRKTEVQVKSMLM